jgi:hypothetical protein
MTLDWKHWLLSHLIWVALAAGLFVGFRSWRAEHDQRMADEKAVAVSQQVVKSLQDQITQRDAASAKQVQTIVKVIHDVATPQQAVAALPTVLQQPLASPVSVSGTGDWLVPKADVLTIFGQLADDKICRAELTTASADLVSEKAINTQLTGQIAILKKKPKFWSRVKSDLKKVGVGVALTVGAEILLRGKL